MPWPEDFLLIGGIPFEAVEKHYYPHYSALLYDVFPPGSPFMVSPSGPTNVRWHSDFSIQVAHHVFLTPLVVEIKPATHFDTISAREYADWQMRQRLTSLMSAPIHLPTVYGLSFLGRRVCFYRLEEGGEVIPFSIPRDPDIVNDVAPQQGWRMDILEQDTEDQIRDLVITI
ncbi:hypothetical protein Clacol_005393 [Clathrus columnatus]|uniref:Restriction endonuclease domain-containing protein n=1 Tax=Clathrus columnatus TaxID=1419009 RepID=A0AAV5A957_9AGAM|nr:hypothetical protein Clacol_005393 [Clathrus columnatus]